MLAVALESIEEQYVEDMRSFVETSDFCKTYELYEPVYLGYRDGHFLFNLKSYSSKNEMIFHLNPYDLSVVGCFFPNTKICFHVGYFKKERS